MNGPERPRSLVRTAAATYATNLAAVALSLVNVLIIARTLGPAGRGDVALLVAVAIVTAHLASLSVQEANANLAGSDPALRPALATNSVLLALGLSAVGAIVVASVVTAVPAVAGDVEPALLWLSLAAVFPVVLRTYLSFLLQADYAFAATNRAWLAGPLTGVVVNATLAAAGAISVTSAMCAWLLGQLLGLSLLILHVRRHAGFGRPDRALAERSVGFGLKTHVGHTMEVGNYRADQWFLGAAAGSRELGLYSIAVSCAEVLFYLPGVLVLIQRPDLVRARATDAFTRAARMLRSALVGCVPAVALTLAVAPLACTLIFGAGFEGAADDLRILALGVFGVSGLLLLRNALTAQREPMLASAAEGVAFAFMVALNLLLVPAYGGAGAAIAMTVAQTCGGLAAAVLFARATGGRISGLVPRPADLTWLWGKLRSGVTGAPAAHGGGG
jgi:O-antigen/teichoic acid export membrane protein